MGIYLKGLDLFPALVSREAGLYQVEFFDIPDCRASGVTAAEAEYNAAKALRAHVDLLDRNGRSLPSPSLITDSGRVGGYVAHIACPPLADVRQAA